MSSHLVTLSPCHLVISLLLTLLLAGCRLEPIAEPLPTLTAPVTSEAAIVVITPTPVTSPSPTAQATSAEIAPELATLSPLDEEDDQTPPTTTPPQTSAPTETATLTPAPTHSPTPAPTATPALVRLAVTSGWTWQVEKALSDLSEREVGAAGGAAVASPSGEDSDTVGSGQRHPAWQWEVHIVSNPAQALESGEADVALIADEADLLIAHQPLVLSVPFTTAWETITLANANTILAAGHPVVRVVDWSAMEVGQKALLVEGFHPTDADYPLQQPWSLVSRAGYEAAAEALARPLRGQAESGVVHLAAVGDLMLERGHGFMIQQQGDLEYPFRHVIELLRAPDVTVGNLESSLGDVGEPQPKRYTFRAPPRAAESLAAAGFDVVSLANNHGMDYGPATLLQGINLLRTAGVAPVGGGADDVEAHAPHFMTVNGLTLAFLAYVHVPVETSTGFDTAVWTAGPDKPGLAWAEPERIRADVAAAREEADLVVVLLHSGREYIEEPDIPQVAAARAAIDAGAALVVGHHPHILQGIEFYNGGVIAYSLGNFAFPYDQELASAILNVWLDADGVRGIELVPVWAPQDGRPRPAEPGEAAEIRRQVYYLSDVLSHGRFSWEWQLTPEP